MTQLLANSEQYIDKSFPSDKGNTECVEFLKQALSAPPTALWKEGAKIKKGTPPLTKGTPIATFVNGQYPQTETTGMHAAIYRGQDALGIHVLDQWNSNGKVTLRTIKWTPTLPGLSKRR